MQLASCGQFADLKWQPFTAGLVAGVANVLAGHPLDTVKVRLQIGQGKALSRQVLRDFRLLYAGISGPLMTSPWIAAANFGVWEVVRVALTKEWPEHFASKDPQSEAASGSSSAVFVAGLASGWLLCNFTCPMHNIKVQQQTSLGLGLWEAVLRAGPRGLFRGYLPHALAESVGRGWYMLGFVGSKRLLGVDSDGRQAPRGVGGELEMLGRRVLCGCTGGGVAWLVVYPFDVIRNRMMWDWRREQYSGMGDCLLQAVKAEGLTGLYRGISYSLARALPVAAITLPTYDLALKYLSA
ncbi:unnamed protein product [Polarella glacialis]|uniref:Mitochondrial carrier protein n=1 Tax=Polarella glacialis TaxID=89957 RepID=A0A813E6H2_POLGL|nr:unnamed protein product [Polarella glacialis]